MTKYSPKNLPKTNNKIPVLLRWFRALTKKYSRGKILEGGIRSRWIHSLGVTEY